MRRLALLVAGGALWLILAALPTSADGGPHQLAVNNGTSGLSGDCAACHRAHTAQAADLLKAPMPDLCTNCHDGTGATTDVVDGVQYVPDGAGNPTGTVLGALRGGGFSYALIDTANASRLTYNRSGGTLIDVQRGADRRLISLTFAAPASRSPATVTFAGTDTAATIQATANAVFGTSTAYSVGHAREPVGHPGGWAERHRDEERRDTTVAFAYHNAFRTVRVALPTISANDLVDAGATADAESPTTRRSARPPRSASARPARPPPPRTRAPARSGAMARRVPRMSGPRASSSSAPSATTRTATASTGPEHRAR